MDDGLHLLGRLHPLVLHFPIGLLVAVALLEAGARRRRELAAAIDLLLPLAAATAVVAAGCGLLLARSGEYDMDLLGRHRFLGLAVAGFSLAAVALRCAAGRRPALARMYAGVLGLGLVALVGAGHYGASLTHGSNYLSGHLPGWLGGAASTDDTVTAVRQSDRDVVEAVLAERCFGCHGPEKQKSGLRLDRRELALAGGESGLPALVPGNVMASRMIEFITLPRSDDRAMPPSGKPRLTAAETLAVIEWVHRGAPWPDPLVEGLGPASEEAILRLRAAGALVGRLTAGSPLVQVDFRPLGDRVGVEALAALELLASHVAWLDLSGTGMRDADLRHLESMDRLTRLSLARTAVGDAGLVHLRELANLRYLNLYGTRVTDVGLRHLSGLARLEHLYLWQTRTTAAGADLLATSLSALEIDLGLEALIE